MKEQCCATCDLFALEPGKRRSGVCFYRWLPYAKYCNQGIDYVIGAYGRVFPWGHCDEWIEQGTIERKKPYSIKEGQ